MDMYNINLTFKVPNDNGRLLDFRQKVYDIIYAVEEFNYTVFPNTKKLYLNEIEKKVIKLILFIEKKGKVTARDISVFSKRLYHDKNWIVFTKETAKLFTAKLEKVRPGLAYMKFDESNFISDEVISLTQNYPKDLSNKTIFYNHILSDEDLKNWIEKLIKTQNQGNEFQVEKKKRVIYQLKEIIKNYLL